MSIIEIRFSRVFQSFLEKPYPDEKALSVIVNQNTSTCYIRATIVSSQCLLLCACSSYCRSTNRDNCVIKFSEDAAILGLMHKNSAYQYKERVVKWCDKNPLTQHKKNTWKRQFFDPRSPSLWGFIKNPSLTSVPARNLGNTAFWENVRKGRISCILRVYKTVLT